MTEFEIDQFDAFYTTLREAYAQEIPQEHIDHLEKMWTDIKLANMAGTPFSPAKLGRWLGWAQATVVFHSDMTLEDFRHINMLHRMERKRP